MPRRPTDDELIETGKYGRREAERYFKRHTDFRCLLRDIAERQDPVGDLRLAREKFFTLVEVGEPDQCWLWKGTIGPRGYGAFTPFAYGYTYVASRVALEFAEGPLPFRTFACHRCDNPPCCNHGHLFPGSGRDNMRDMRTKDRGRAHLTNAEALEIRLRYGHSNSTIAGLAREYGVPQESIRSVLDRKTFRHVKITRETRDAWLKRDLDDFLKSRAHGRSKKPGEKS